MSESYQDTEERIEQALEDIANGIFTNTTKAAHWHEVEPRTLQRRVKGGASKTSRAPTNLRLSQEQEKVLCQYIDLMDRLNLQIRMPQIRGTAEFILFTGLPAGTPHKPLGPKWVKNFLLRYPHYKIRRQQPLASDRKDSYDVNVAMTHFQRFKDERDSKGIQEEDIWNMDETGFRVGCGIAHMVVTRHVNRTLFLRDAENRDFCTSIECISGGGVVIPPHLILKGTQILHKWGNTEIPDDYLIGTSDTGYSNSSLVMDWIEHFDRFSSKSQVGLWRMLVFDGADSHFIKPFFDYCMEAKIMPFILPPKATSWAQPLDVGCFQPLKHYHTEAIDSAVRMGDDEFNRLDFLDQIHVIREQAFKTTTIKSAFRKTGLIPWNPNVVLDPMRQRNDRARQVTPPPPAPTGPLLERTPSKPRELIDFGSSMIDKFESIDWMHDDFKTIVARYVRAATVSARTVRILQRDLFNVHKAAKRKAGHKAIGSSVAQKSGSMTAGMIRESYQAKKENEVKQAELRLERAKRGVIIRAEKRITSNRKWLKDYNKELWKDLSDQKGRWVQWFTCLEAIELQDYKLYPLMVDSDDDD